MGLHLNILVQQKIFLIDKNKSCLITMSGNSYYDIPSLVNDINRPFILERLNQEQFPIVKALTPRTIPIIKIILRDVFEGRTSLHEAVLRTEREIQTPIGYRKVRRWAERLIRTEVLKLYTLGYGDYLLSIGETECYVPPNEYDADMECRYIIEGKIFPIKMIQENIYKNYGHRKGMQWYPTVPLHPNCRHIIIKKPEL